MTRAAQSMIGNLHKNIGLIDKSLAFEHHYIEYWQI